MLEKLQRQLNFRFIKNDKILLIASIALTAVLSLWAMFTPAQHEDHVESASELGTSIPKGYSIVPLELSNSQGLSGMIAKNGIIDVFMSKQNAPLIENLRILKLSAGEGPLFGALIPEKMVGKMQNILERSGLRGVLKPANAATTKINLPNKRQKLIQEITIEEDL